MVVKTCSWERTVQGKGGCILLLAVVMLMINLMLGVRIVGAVL